ncbi:MAG: hypothetical protein HN686_17990, partial [Bacteroidetes bacterium]|nr:hypothetical protein [Bacteroidota bacterium]
YQYQNNEKFQGSILVNLEGGTDHRWNSLPDTSSTFHSGTIYPNVYYYNRWYINKNWFIEANAILATRYRKTNDFKEYYGGLTVPLLVGKGRIEPVQDARQAVYILQDLKSSDLLAREPSEKEILEIASEISSLKNKRFLDHRLRRIYELKALDSLFVNMGLLSENNVVFYTHLTDNWGFTNGPVRWSGERFSAGIRTQILASEAWKDPVDFKDFLDQIYPVANEQILLNYELQRPVSLYWQNQLLLGTSYRIFDQWINLRNIKGHHAFESYKASISILYGWAYYPNSRTSLSLRSTLLMNFGGIPENPEQSAKEFNYDLKPGLYFSGEYYFSPQLTVEVNYNAFYSFARELEQQNGSILKDINKHSQVNQYLTAKFLYSIF